ncbi:MAG: hypothetical protein Q4A82_04580 [Corynebacterium sp.]|nr:hypothetical protein [Corynebacterium sp.]
MSDKQLTVAELLAKAGREGDGDTPRRRRRRSVESGGVSVAELTGRIPKVEAKPAESRHSSDPLDAEETYTGPFSAVANSGSLFGDSPSGSSHVTSLFDDHSNRGPGTQDLVDQPDPSEPPATLSFFTKTDNSGPGGSAPSSFDATSATTARKPPVASAPTPAAAPSVPPTGGGGSAAAATSAPAAASSAAMTPPTMAKPTVKRAMKPVMKPVMKQSLMDEPITPLTSEVESEQDFVDLGPSDDSTIVLSVVDEGGPVRLTTGTFPRLKDHHFTKASVEDLAQPPELPMQKKVAEPTRAEQALTQSFQKVAEEQAAAQEEQDLLEAPVQEDELERTAIAGFPVISEEAAAAAAEEVDEYDDYEFEEDDDELIADDLVDDLDEDELEDALVLEEDLDEEEEETDFQEPSYQAASRFRRQQPQPAAELDDDDDDEDNDPFIDEFDEFDEEFDDEYDEDSAKEKMSVLAILGMAAFGILLGVGIFAGFQLLWDKLENKLIVGGLAILVIAVIVSVVHVLRTSRAGFSMTLAGLVGATMTFGPLAIVGMQ